MKESKKTILITGATGFIGRACVKAFSQAGFYINILTRKKDGVFSDNENIKIFHGDLSQVNTLEKAIEGTSGVLHLAWSSVPRTATQNPIEDVASNVIGTLNILEVMKKKKVNKFAFISSGGTVYGIPKYNPIQESHATNPISAYGISKLSVEKYARLYEQLYGINTLILRVANAYGPFQNFQKGQGVIGFWMNAIKDNKPINIIGNCNTIRDFIYVDDLANAILQAWIKTEKGIFNLGSGKGVSLLELAQTLEKVIQRKLEILHLPSRGFDVPENVLDVSKFSQLTGWAPEVKLEEGLKRTWQSF